MLTLLARDCFMDISLKFTSGRPRTKGEDHWQRTRRCVLGGSRILNRETPQCCRLTGAWLPNDEGTEMRSLIARARPEEIHDIVRLICSPSSLRNAGVRLRQERFELL